MVGLRKYARLPGFWAAKQTGRPISLREYETKVTDRNYGVWAEIACRCAESAFAHPPT